MKLSKNALNIIKQLADKTPITITGETINEAAMLLKEIKDWVDSELQDEQTPVDKV